MSEGYSQKEISHGNAILCRIYTTRNFISHTYFYFLGLRLLLDASAAEGELCSLEGGDGAPGVGAPGAGAPGMTPRRAGRPEPPPFAGSALPGDSSLGGEQAGCSELCTEHRPWILWAVAEV